MSESEINTRNVEEGIVELQLGRAPINALTSGFLNRFAEEITALGQEKSVRAIILSSPFKVFSAGVDLKDAKDFTLSEQFEIVQGLNEAFLALYACPKPVVASVGGAAIAGGLFFVLASDRRVALSKSTFGLSEVQAGVDFPVGPLEIAKATLDPDTQRRLMLTGQPIGPIAARNAGFIDIIADDEEDLWAFSLSEARKLSDLPSQSYAAIKQQLRGETITKIRSALAQGANQAERGWFNEQTTAAMQKILDKG